ncbi:hypothetical protein, partial [Mediterraneibacter sp. 210702-DFI.5.30]|uniref:hypothetical protein n=1 Tax=Mediterraneibacter sp. 210702-DFI.5.30 TaxID=2883232 RepID=UPI001D08EE28
IEDLAVISYLQKKFHILENYYGRIKFIMYRFIVQQLTAAGARMCQGIFFVLYYLILKIKYLLKVYGKIELRKTINQST